jgi:hypothetical protein
MSAQGHAEQDFQLEYEKAMERIQTMPDGPKRGTTFDAVRNAPRSFSRSDATSYTVSRAAKTESQRESGARPRRPGSERRATVARKAGKDRGICQGSPKCPQFGSSKIPHPDYVVVASSIRTSPAFSFSLSR